MRLSSSALLPLAIVSLWACGHPASGTSGGIDSGTAGGSDAGGLLDAKAIAFDAVKSKMATYDGSNRVQENRDLLAGSRVLSVASGLATGVNATHSLEWSAFPAEFAPDSTTAE